ncbi:hypothetical protein [Nostoc sp. FACHB-888]|uniref:hypothetical protein n=1 Tax=Nostoc sp. FACHB-888 TaxID=2692842 RepID=UPI001689AB9A|nr:hypothetical protein [Nostoc sp. FACHB-888]MBD2247299.1 hypothetical protein [Nostoc sp. FACHB-888]
MNDNSQRGDFLQALGQTGVLVFLVVMAMVVRSCSFFEAKAIITNTSKIAENTDEFIGNSVTVKSRVSQKIGSSSFTVSDARFFRGEPLVVVNASGVP